MRKRMIFALAIVVLGGMARANDGAEPIKMMIGTSAMSEKLFMIAIAGPDAQAWLSNQAAANHYEAQTDSAAPSDVVVLVGPTQRAIRSGRAVAENVLFQPHDADGIDGVVRPTKASSDPHHYSNLLGGSRSGNSLVAHFDLAAIQAMPAGDIDVIVITGGKPAKGRISAKDRALIR